MRERHWHKKVKDLNEKMCGWVGAICNMHADILENLSLVTGSVNHWLIMTTTTTHFPCNMLQGGSQYRLAIFIPVPSFLHFSGSMESL
jgi:hypothetical protein